MSDSPSRSGETPTSRREAITAAAAALGLGGLATSAMARQDTSGANSGEPSELAVLWTSADPDVAHRVGLMYTHAARTNAWFRKVRLVAWGPSQRTLVGDKDLRAKIADMQSDGVILQACIVCAESFGLVDELRELGFEVIPMGAPLSGFLKDANVSVITF